MKSLPYLTFLSTLTEPQSRQVRARLSLAAIEDVDHDDIDSIGDEYRHMLLIDAEVTPVYAAAFCWYKKVSPHHTLNITQAHVEREVIKICVFDNELEYEFYKNIFELDTAGANVVLFN